MERPALGHVLGYTVLTVMLTAGAAQSLAGSNTVTSDDIVDFSIVANDIKTAAIGGRPIVDNSLTGADINESTLSLPSSPKYYKWTWHSNGTTEAASTATVSGPGLVVPVSATITNRASIDATCDRQFLLDFRLEPQFSNNGALTKFDGDSFTFNATAPIPLLTGERTTVGAGAACVTEPHGEFVSPPAFDATVILAVYPLESNPSKPTVIN